VSGQLPPRRRRIAGERRAPLAAAADQDAPEVADETPVSETGQVAPERSARSTAPTEPVERLDSASVEPAAEERGGWWGSTTSLVVLTLALVLLLTVTGLGLAGLLGNRGVPQIREAAAVQEAEETAPSVAERAAGAILAYDYKTLDADQDSAERFMTADFAEKYSASFTKAVAPAARTYKAQVTAEVIGTSVVRATEDRVRVLVFVDQTTVATNKKNPQVALNRAEFDMVLRGGTWLVDNITSY
jgi:Mce-associated membrane protein